MKQKIKPIYVDPESKGTTEELTTFGIVFSDETDHYSYIEQFVKKSVKYKYCSKNEMKEALEEYLSSE